jgi:hypothetical protein
MASFMGDWLANLATSMAGMLRILARKEHDNWACVTAGYNKLKA